MKKEKLASSMNCHFVTNNSALHGFIEGKVHGLASQHQSPCSLLPSKFGQFLGEHPSQTEKPSLTGMQVWQPSDRCPGTVSAPALTILLLP